ncbi:MAG: hypothetical protein IIU49_01280 [Spirochaetales bacterium]|nr:hypothetical protein [Spirochaetales bacterium]
MLERRRVFDLTNTIMNYVFLVFLLLAGIYFVSFWFELRNDFINTIVSCVNVVAWTVTAISVMLVTVALVIAFADHEINVWTLVWCIVRMVICIAVSIVIDACAVLVSEGVKVTL